MSEKNEKQENYPYLFDIVFYESLESGELKEHIDREGKIFYERDKF